MPGAPPGPVFAVCMLTALLAPRSLYPRCVLRLPDRLGERPHPQPDAPARLRQPPPLLQDSPLPGRRRSLQPRFSLGHVFWGVAPCCLASPWRPRVHLQQPWLLEDGSSVTNSLLEGAVRLAAGSAIQHCHLQVGGRGDSEGTHCCEFWGALPLLAAFLDPGGLNFCSPCPLRAW